MVTFLITAFAILSFLAVVIYFWQKPDKKDQTQSLVPYVEPRSLFAVESTDSLKSLAAANLEQQQSEIIERASRGEKSALREAHILAIPSFYDRVLDLFVSSAKTDPELLALLSYITRSELRVNPGLARAVIESWQRSPDRSSTAKTIHIVALADDAGLYSEAVQSAIGFWREGRLPDLSQKELRALIEGEFWLLSGPVRASGAGFLLKRTLARARRELEPQAQVN